MAIPCTYPALMFFIVHWNIFDQCFIVIRGRCERGIAKGWSFK
jgi:hypothetical protein